MIVPYSFFLIHSIKFSWPNSWRIGRKYLETLIFKLWALRSWDIFILFWFCQWTVLLYIACNRYILIVRSRCRWTDSVEKHSWKMFRFPNNIRVIVFLQPSLFKKNWSCSRTIIQLRNRTGHGESMKWNYKHRALSVMLRYISDRAMHLLNCASHGAFQFCTVDVRLDEQIATY